MGYLDNCVSVSLLGNILSLSDIILAYWFKYIWVYIQLRSFGAKGINTGGTCITYIYTKDAYTRFASNKVAYVKGVSIESISIKSANTKNTSIRGTYTRGTFFIDTCTRMTDIESAYIRVFSTQDTPNEGTYVKNICA